MQTAALLVQRLFEETQGEASAASETGWEGVDCGVVVDASGNSLLHWAAAHARVDAVSQLMKRGVNADASRRNYVGETPLMRAVMSFAAYESQNMDSLLALLADSLPVADSSGRTVLHHAALSAAVRGRVFAARYYTDCIAKFLTSGDSHLDAQARESFVNSSDINGDTALISAARIGDLNIVESLISQMVARVDVQNCAGLVAADFGLNSDLLACPIFTTNGASWPEIHNERESSQTPPPSRSGSGTSNSASTLKGKVNHQTLVTPPSSSASHINSGPVGSLTSAIQTESQLPASATDFSRLCQTSLNTIQSTINNLHQMYTNTISVHISKLNDIESEVNSLSKHHSALDREKTVLLQNKRKLQQKLDGGVVDGAHKRLVKLRRRLEREEGRVTICRAAVRELNEKTGVMLLSTVATGSIQSRKQYMLVTAQQQLQYPLLLKLNLLVAMKEA
ncbi:ankyrin repeat-containing domain protein [Chytriomyces sp. MP71]|nr:ankyrin repeat-containing domain protein [Chytriomyces sp. MP71]